ncbi:MAG: winged helix-turn-helix transcriptional regulator [Nitrososphaerales archaeon]
MSKKEKCPIEETLKIIGKKWTLLILRDIFEGKNRFNQFQKSIQGISPKTLSKRLKELEKNGLVVRKVFAEVPPHVEYTLTEKGKELKGIVESIQSYGQKFLA